MRQLNSVIYWNHTNSRLLTFTTKIFSKTDTPEALRTGSQQEIFVMMMFS